MERKEVHEQSLQVVAPRYGSPEFLKKRLQVLLGALLAVKTNCVSNGIGLGRLVIGDLPISFGLVDPLSCCPFHKGRSPWS